MPPRKIDRLVALMHAGDWRRALSMAARFPRLGEHADAIRHGHEAMAHPKFYRQLKRDPEAMVAAGVAALMERYAKSMSGKA